MNLYGDYGNICALQKILTANGIKSEVDTLSVGDKPHFSDYDFVYVGSGTEENQKLALRHLSDYKDELKAYFDSEKTALFTGNSFEMLGNEINGFSERYEGLGILDFYVSEQNKKRITADIVAEREGLQKPIVGFINKCSEIYGVANPLFSVKMGVGNNSASAEEGICEKGFICTHITGPILIKNPHFLHYVASRLKDVELDADRFSYENAAYEITLKKLCERI